MEANHPQHYLEPTVKKAVFILPLLSILPLSAQSWEAGLFLGQQTYKAGSFSPTANDLFDYKTDSKFVYGIRLGHSVVDLGPALFEVNVAYQPEVTSTTTVTQTSVVQTGQPAQTLRGRAAATGNLTSTSTSTGDLKAGYYAVGAMFTFKALVAVGVGVDYRFEKIELPGTSTTYNRPWARANVGYAFPSPVVKPFIGVEAAFPFTSKSLDMNNSNEDNVKALAPKAQVGIYAGVRF